MMGMIAGGFSQWIFGYYIPSNGLFKNRHTIYGMANGAGFFLLVLINNLFAGKTIVATSLILQLLTCVALGILISGSIFKRNYRKLLKGTLVELVSGEMEILTDTAIFENEDIRRSGRVILTNERIIFISNEIDNFSYTIEFKGEAAHPEIWKNKAGMPAGIIVHGGVNLIKLRFPMLWQNLILLFDNARMEERQMAKGQ